MSKESVTAGAAGVGLLVLRLGLGSVMFAHGLQKLGVFGGDRDLNTTIQRWQEVQGIPPWLGYLAITAEVAGGLGLIIGLFGRLAAFGIACTMAVATFKVHLPNGFWNSDRGFEFPMILMIAAIALMLTGMGSISLDSRIAKRMDKTIGSK
ncbi:MAG: DoxX family protein [Fimbriimonadales bacterium]|nr:DoxX family protein [Fimbriimonadales bacterium]